MKKIILSIVAVLAVMVSAGAQEAMTTQRYAAKDFTSLSISNGRRERHLIEDVGVVHIAGNGQREAVDGDLVSADAKVVEDDAIDGTAHRGLGRDGAVHLVEALAADAPFAFKTLVAGSIPHHAVVLVVEVLVVVCVVGAFEGYGPKRVERFVCPDIASDKKKEHGEQGKESSFFHKGLCLGFVCLYCLYKDTIIYIVYLLFQNKKGRKDCSLT